MANIPALAGYQNANGEAAVAKFGGGDVLTDPNGNVLAIGGAGMALLGEFAGQVQTISGTTIFINNWAYPSGTKHLRISAKIGSENAAHLEQRGDSIIQVPALTIVGFRSGSTSTGANIDTSWNGVAVVPVFVIAGVNSDNAQVRISAISVTNITVELWNAWGVTISGAALVEAWG